MRVEDQLEFLKHCEDTVLGAGASSTLLEGFLAKLLKVRSKTGALLPMRPNRVQKEFARRCGKRNIVLKARQLGITTYVAARFFTELKAHMRWLIGTGNEGKMQEVAERVQKHEAYLQRMGGIGAAFGVLLTLVHVLIDYLRVHR